MEPNPPSNPSLVQLVAIVRQLRSPEGGCPWDLAQTSQTLIPYLLEEAYEVADALRQGEPQAIADELGDLLLQVVLQSQIAQEQGQFTLQDVADQISAKLVRRHPHVFGDCQVETLDQVRQNWEAIKAEENQAQKGLIAKLEQYNRSLPPLVASLKISRMVAAHGLEWQDVAGVWDKFREELEEFHQALAAEDHAAQTAELGDLLFTLVNLARWYDLDPSAALQGTQKRLIQRLSKIEAATSRPLAEHSPAELEALWQQAKQELGQGRQPPAEEPQGLEGGDQAKTQSPEAGWSGPQVQG